MFQKRERGRMRVHHASNVSTALRALRAAGVRLVNIASADVVDGNPKLILGNAPRPLFLSMSGDVDSIREHAPELSTLTSRGETDPPKPS